MKNILIISALAGVLALSSCWRDDLYYATVDRATVRIEADWTPGAADAQRRFGIRVRPQRRGFRRGPEQRLPESGPLTARRLL